MSRFRRSSRLAAFASIFALWTAALAAPAAANCVWGQPGYRACVEAKIARQKQREAEGQPREIFKTAPANQRPPSLTPIPEGSGAMPSAPRVQTGGDWAAARRDRQWQLDLDRYRMQRDAGDPRAYQRLRQLDLNRAIDAGANAGAQRQQQFDMNILRMQRDGAPRPIQP